MVTVPTVFEATLEAVGASETLEPIVYSNTWRRIPDLLVVFMTNTGEPPISKVHK